jgi:hypothetical protein
LAFVLRNAAIAGFPMAKEILDDVKGVLHACPDAGFQSFRVLGQSFDFDPGSFFTWPRLRATCQSTSLPSFSGRFAAPV